MAQSPQSQNDTVREQSFMLDPFPTPDSPDWETMNQRRFELIQKKVRASLSEDERLEFEYLQRMTSDAVEKAFPRPPVDPVLLSLIRELRGSAPGKAE